MSKYYALPSLYLGSNKEARNLFEEIAESYAVNAEQFGSQNLFLKHLIVYALTHDRSLKDPKKS